MTEDGKPIIKFTIQYAKYKQECYDFQMNKHLEGYDSNRSKRFGGGFIMYDLEDQEEALEFLRKDLSNVFYIKYVNYALIGTTENSNEKI